jgi:hypothetical protein
MRKPNPILLDILMRAGAYPFDDFEVQGQDAGVWIIPQLGSDLLLVVAIIHNGTVVDPLVRELRRIAQSTLCHHGYDTPRENNAYRWTYQILYQCTETVGRVLDRDIRIRTEQELAVMLNSYAFIPWFLPDERYHGNKAFDGSHLPELIVPDIEDVTPEGFVRGSGKMNMRWATGDIAQQMQQDLDSEFGGSASDSYHNLAEGLVGPQFNFDEMFEDFDEEDAEEEQEPADDDEDFEDDFEDDEEDEGFEDDEEDEEDEDESVVPEPESPEPPAKQVKRSRKKAGKHEEDKEGSKED